MSNTTIKTRKFKTKRNIKPTTTIKTSITDKRSKTSTVKGFKIIDKTTDTITTKRPFYPSSIHAKDYLDLVEKNCIFNQDLNKDDFLEWKQITN